MNWIDKQFDLVMSMARTKAFGTVICYFVLFLLFKDSQVDQHLLLIWVAAGIVLGLSMILVPHYAYYRLRHKMELFRKHKTVTWGSVPTVVSPYVWLFAQYLVVTGLSIEDRSILAVMLAGIAAVSVSTSGFSFRLSVVNVLGYLLPFVAVNFYLGDRFGIAMGSLAILYIFFMVSLARTHSKALYQNFMSNQENYQLIKDLEEKTVTLAHTSRLASLGEMAGGIAHEINNPLAIIEGYADMLREQVEMGVASHQRMVTTLGKITETTHRMTHIISALKRFSRLDNSYVTKNESIKDIPPVDLEQILEEHLLLCQEKFSARGIDLNLNPPKDSPILVSMDEIQLSQVLMNLLNNAHDAVKDEDHKWITIGFEKRQSMGVISIENAGPPIPSEIAEKIMQPFFSTKPMGEGTGLGLSICYGIMREYGGSISLDTTCPHPKFTVSMPLQTRPIEKTA